MAEGRWRVKAIEHLGDRNGESGLKRSLGPIHLTLIGVGSIVGTGIFVLTGIGAERAGPGLILAFVIAGFVCAMAALAFAELASMIPVAGSAYTYTYATLGELAAWIVGWCLILEYAIAASAVAVPQADCRKRRRDQPSAAARSSAMSRTRSSITFCFGVCGIG